MFSGLAEKPECDDLAYSTEDQCDATDQHKHPRNRRHWDIMSSFRSDLQWAEIDRFFPGLVTESLVCKQEDSSEDQDDPNDGGRFHRCQKNKWLNGWVPCQMF